MMRSNKFALAESPLYIDDLNSWCWVDINSNEVWRLDSHGERLIIDLKDLVPSNITHYKPTPNSLLVTTDKNILLLNYVSGSVSLIFQLENPISIRCNDGSVGPDGKYWFGTMEKTPTGLNGRLYSLDNEGDLVDQNADIGIPNSFIWLDDKQVLISDSFLQKTFKVALLPSGTLDWENRCLWLDLSDKNGTPDGGALDVNGNVWLAVWGDASIHKYSPEGSLLEKIELNALQPSSCAFGGVNMDELLITTATEGMTEEQLKMYPESGKALLKKMNVKGSSLPVFNLEV